MSLSAEAQSIPPEYVDPKRRSWLLSLLVPSLTLVGPLLFFLTDSAAMLWLPLGIFYFVMPLFDWLLGEDRSNPPEEAVPALEADPYYRYVTYALVPLLWTAFIFAAWFTGTYFAAGLLPWHGVLAMGLTGGVIFGFGNNVGHELGHKRSRLERNLARIVLAIGAYGHFNIEHNRGHHRYVATPEDTASARMGENIYQFALRELPGGLKRAWALEKQRLHSEGKAVYSVHNEILQPAMLTALAYSGLIAMYGWVMVPFLTLVMVWGAFQLTSANYVEHYGLLRKRLEGGRLEKCRPHHSWNSNHRLSNLALFHLQRHSDHHAHAARRYQSLRHLQGLPELPSGYFGMFIVAYCPPLWFRVMDRRLLDHVRSDPSRINFQPERKAALCARYNLC